MAVFITQLPSTPSSLLPPSLLLFRIEERERGSKKEQRKGDRGTDTSVPTACFTNPSHPLNLTALSVSLPYFYAIGVADYICNM